MLIFCTLLIFALIFMPFGRYQLDKIVKKSHLKHALRACKVQIYDF